MFCFFFFVLWLFWVLWVFCLLWLVFFCSCVSCVRAMVWVFVSHVVTQIVIASRGVGVWEDHV
ncbi:hypothetical protein RA266_27940, partial [Pseudomonas syringae pv. tagetis]|uniref:hypothetical protein n=1 Tax=Pseudomonas syringae group genomosp. 7 TaxID=251699 RepID=UPI00376F9BAD